MKNILKSIILAVVLLAPSLALAQLNVTGGGTGQSSFPLKGWIFSDTAFKLNASSSPTVNWITATSTTASSTLPKLNSTIFSAGTICLTGDTCRTTWPTGGSGSGSNWGFSNVQSMPVLTPTSTTYSIYGNTTDTTGLPYGGGFGALFARAFSTTTAEGASVVTTNAYTGLATTSDFVFASIPTMAAVYGHATATNYTDPNVVGFFPVGVEGVGELGGVFLGRSVGLFGVGAQTGGQFICTTPGCTGLAVAGASNLSGSVGISSNSGGSPALSVQGETLDSTTWNSKFFDNGSNFLAGIRNDGRVGVATATPSAKLSVNGDVMFMGDNFFATTTIGDSANHFTFGRHEVGGFAIPIINPTAFVGISQPLAILNGSWYIKEDPTAADGAGILPTMGWLTDDLNTSATLSMATSTGDVGFSGTGNFDFNQNGNLNIVNGGDLVVQSFAGSGNRCLHTDNDGIISATALDCGTGGGGGGTDVNWTWFNGSGIQPATSTNQVLIGGTSTTTSDALEVTGSGFFSNTAKALHLWATGSSTLQNVTLANGTSTAFAITSLPSAILKTNAGGSIIPAISGTDYLVNAVTAIGPTGQTQTGPTVTIASSSVTTNGLAASVTVVGAGNTLTFTPSVSGTLTAPGGGTGSTTLSGILKGNGTGAVQTAVPGTDYVANVLGDWTGTFDGQEGTYYLDARNLTNFGVPFYTFFNATTTSALAEGSNLYYTAARFNTAFAGKTTTDLTEGSNLYFTDARVGSYLTGSTTLPAFLNYWTKSGSNLNYIAGNVSVGTTSAPAVMTVSPVSTAYSGRTFGVHNPNGAAFLTVDTNSSTNSKLTVNGGGASSLPITSGLISVNHNFSNIYDPLLNLASGTSYPFVLQNLNGAVGSTTGICFTVTNVSGNCGGAIVFERTGGNSQGKLNFYAKDSATAGAAPALALTLTTATSTFAGQVDIPVTAATGVGVITRNGTRFIHSLGTGNTFMGENAGNLTLSGADFNTGIGRSSLLAITTGDDNVAVGFAALDSITTQSDNTAVGNFALGGASGSRNTALGFGAMQSGSGVDSVSVGYLSLGAATSSGLNVAVGKEALRNVAGSSNIGIGYQAGDNLTYASNNIVIGTDIDAPLSTGSNQLNIGNMIFGTTIDGTGTTISTGKIGIGTTTPDNKLDVMDTFGISNSSPGNGFLRLTNASGINYIQSGLTSASGSVAPIVWAPMKSTTNNMRLDATGLGIGGVTPTEKLDVNGNVNLPTTSSTVGQWKVNGTRFAHTFGTNNIFLGLASGNFSLTTGSAIRNTGIGADTLDALTTGYENVAIGAQALTTANTGFQNTAIGYQALNACTGCQFNVGIGAGTLLGVTTNIRNIAIGNSAGEGVTGDNNILIGVEAGRFIGASSQNTIVGNNTGAYVNGTGNTLLGAQASTSASISYGTAIGYGALVGGSDSVSIGTSTTKTGLGTTTPGWTLSVSGGVGFNPTGIPTNTGASTYSLCLSAGGAVTKNSDGETCIASSRRFKKDIEYLASTLSKVIALKPVKFQYKEFDGEHYGLIAEDVAEVDPLLSSYDEKGLPNGIHWSNVTALLVGAVKDQQTQIDALKGGASEVKKTMEDEWQWVLIGLLALGFAYQQIEIRRLKK